MNRFLALTSAGIENLLLEELQDLGASKVKQSIQMVHFESDLEGAWNVCLWSRFATRVLALIGEFDVDNVEQLYNSVKSLPWHDYLDVNQRFAIDFVGTNRFIKNTQFGGLKVKDALADYFVAHCGERPSVDKYQPDVLVQARLRNNKLAIYLDFSGPSLHQRGYREGQGGAPLKENLAAAIISRSGWLNDTSQPLYDPFCGSGTLLIEAVSMANNTAPGLTRERFAFENLPNYDEAAFKAVYKKAEAAESVVEDLDVIGSDINQKLVHTARANADAADVARHVRFVKTDAAKLKKAQKRDGVIVCNPPYGERLGEFTEVAYLYAAFGLSLKQHFCGWKLAFFTQDTAPTRQLRLAKSKSYKFRNGPLDCLLYIYDLNERQCQLSDEHRQGSALLYHFNESESFFNRLKKNDKKYRQLAKKENVDCFRIYDGDIPEYNVAVDRYADKVVVFEYAAPKSVDEAQAKKRLADVMLIVPEVLGVAHQDVALKVRERKKGSSQYESLNKRNETFEVNEYGLRLNVNIHDYLDTGLFLDHRITRRKVGELARGKSVLNLFAYTGTASVHAAAGGAESVTTVDMSKTYLDWAKRNFELNRFTGRRYDFVQADCLAWITSGDEKFDLIFIDPPTFSNSKRMDQSFDVLRDHGQLLVNLKQRLHKGGTIIFSNNHRRFKMAVDLLQAEGFMVENITDDTIPFDFARNRKIHNCWRLTLED